MLIFKYFFVVKFSLFALFPDKLSSAHHIWGCKDARKITFSEEFVCLSIEEKLLDTVMPNKKSAAPKRKSFLGLLIFKEIWVWLTNKGMMKKTIEYKIPVKRSPIRIIINKIYK